MNIARFLEKAAKTYPNAPAVQCGDTRLTYRELSDRVQRLSAGLLAAGAQPGDRVAVWMKNSADFVEVLFAIFWSGFVAVPINAGLHPKDIDHIVEDSQARLLIYHDQFAEIHPGFISTPNSNCLAIPVSELTYPESHAGPEDRLPNDNAWLFYTSGTTGKSKGAILTHANLAAQCVGSLADLYSFQPEDVVLHAAPLSHGSGMQLLASIARGSFNLISEGKYTATSIFALIAAFKVTAIAFLAPTQIVRLIESDDANKAEMTSVKAVIYGGGPMHLAHIKKALELWGPIWIQLYGQGESPMTGTYLRREGHIGHGEDFDRQLSSVGIARTSAELSIRDESGAMVNDGEIGEICIRAPTVMKGYWRNPEASAAALRDGWLHTGDLGYQDLDGYFHLVDRAKDMIITGGNNVYAREVEDVLTAHPAVSEAAIIGVPDSHWGESIHAVIVLRTGFVLSTEEIIEHCRAHLASYKKPRTVEFLSKLPKNAYGKVLKTDLRLRALPRSGA